MKWQIPILMILLSGMVWADDGLLETYRPNEVFYLPIHLSNSSGDVVGGNCTTQIMMPNYTTLEIIPMNDIGKGEYNATYNTSNVGTYLCRQNCTQGTQYTAGTCDFIIGGGNKVGALIAIVLLLVFVIVFYIYMVRTMNFEIFDNTEFNFGIHNGIKTLIIASSFWIVLIPLNLASYLIDLYIGNPAMTQTITTFYYFCISVNTLIMFYLIYLILKRFGTKLMQ